MKNILALLLMCATVYISFYKLLPDTISCSSKVTLQEFSSERAREHIKKISEKPHYLGNQAHDEVKQYIITALESLGLEVQTQTGYSISQWGNLAKPTNILAKIMGSDSNSKALMLLSHYDSNPHSSYGASDAGSGVATILEGVRAFLQTNTIPKNDIIILFTDSEELGLNGADIFVNKHPWAKDVGLVLNFEARGSGGPSYMLIETNGGNSELIKGFKAAKVEFPVANSLVYSIYKMLPNDTDLTRFREDANINGFNFAFIDDHFDYHTALDTYDRLDRNTLEHQGSYLMPLLSYFSQANLTALNTQTDLVYFNVPYFGLVSYPFSWIYPMLVITIIAFLALVIYGFKKRVLNMYKIARGFKLFIIALLLSGGGMYAIWAGIKALYPQYNEMLHGFTYNGHTYIAMAIALSLTICFLVYRKVNPKDNVSSLLIAPIAIWLIILVAIAIILKGASFFIIPTWCAMLMLWVHIRRKQPNVLLLAVIATPILAIMTPFLKMFPVGLGLNILFVSTLLCTLLFGLIYGVISKFKGRKRYAFISLGLMLGLGLAAHATSGFNKERPKPNSLVYILNADTNTAYWATYDSYLDTWTESFISDSLKLNSNIPEYTIRSKYGTDFTYIVQAKTTVIPEPLIERLKDSIIGDVHHISLKITPQRQARRIELFSPEGNQFLSATLNGVEVYKSSESNFVFQFNRKNSLFSYYITNDEPLLFEFSVPKSQNTKLELYESSYNLIGSQLNVPERPANMIPKPFVLNDAIIVYKTINLKAEL